MNEPDTSDRWVSPTGATVVGTMERIPGTARIVGIEDSGRPVYVGETDVDWDGQETLTRDGKLLFVDEHGTTWTFDELVRASR